ncbi:MAG TPA: HDOD domain-containing protein [Bacillota bacterium]|jgi:HD-like signal output (HDOD) protein|nr:HDOD domain-containing protein [Bacillota bacterium]HPT68035.1 HDOD domain-containing protein [Bacillota bacterium]
MKKEEIFAKINDSNIPGLPPAIKEVFAELKNPATLDMQSLIEKIASFGELETLLLKQFNKNYFRKQFHIKSLHEAIRYFGARTIQNILLYLVIRSFSAKLLDKTGFLRANYWRHCLGASVAAHELATITGDCDPYLMFSYGLIHDIGIFVIEHSLPELILKIREVQKKGLTHFDAEKEAMDGVTHEDIGDWLCKKWELPDEIRNIVAYHHRPHATSLNSNEVFLFHKADVISATYYESLMGIYSFHDRKPVLDALGLDPAIITRIKEILPDEVNKIREIFSF